MPIRTVAADPEIVRRVGLGARQCVECGTVYNDAKIPEWCGRVGCGQSFERIEALSRNDPEAGSYDRTREYDAVYHLTEEQGKAIEEQLKLYAADLHRIHRRVQANAAWELAKLFE